MRYQLMNKDKIVAVYDEQRAIDDFHYELVSQEDPYMPYGFLTMDNWIDDRQIAKHRSSIQRLMNELGMTTRRDFIGMTRCLSLTDTFWMKRQDDPVTWDEISLYQNPFDDVIARIAFDGTGMYGRANSPTSPEYATSGSFAKCWIRDDGDNVFLLKRGSDGAANAGNEPFSEKLASDLLDFLDLEHVPYSLLNYRKKLASACPLFTSEDVGFVAMHRFFDRPIEIRDALDFSAKYDSEDAFRNMVIVDSIIVNDDRHAGNYGFLVDNATGEILKMAPIFDNNMALLPRMMENDDLRIAVSERVPKIGTGFESIAKALMTPEMQSKLIALKNFQFENPGFGCPDWRIDALNIIVAQQIDAILASKTYYTPTNTAEVS